MKIKAKKILYPYEFFTYRNKKEIKHGDTEARRELESMKDE